MNESSIVSVTGWQTTTQRWHTVYAKNFADCSGDSILAPLSGAAYRIGRESASEFGENIPLDRPDKKTMGMSCLIQLRKTERISKYIAPNWATRIPKEVLEFRKPSVKAEGQNFCFLELGGTCDSIHDTEEIRDELIALAYGWLDQIKNGGTVPDADYWELDWLGFLPGKRESRRMTGEYTLTGNDILAGGLFPDTVAYGGWPLDDHYPEGFYHIGGLNSNEYVPSPYGIPYRVLYSINVPNLFFAGRNISATHNAMSSTRVMATGALLGEAVGTAANICREFALTPHGVYQEKIHLLQQRLMENGCFLPYLCRDISDICRNAELTCDFTPPKNLDNLRNGIDRNNHTYGEDDFRVVLPLGKTVGYHFSAPTEVNNIHLQFDTDLDRETLPGNYVERCRSMRANRRQESPTVHLPKTLLKGFQLTAVTESGEKLTIADTNMNILGCLNFSLPKKLYRSISFVPTETWGDSDTQVRIFSFDVR